MRTLEQRLQELGLEAKDSTIPVKVVQLPIRTKGKFDLPEHERRDAIHKAFQYTGYDFVDETEDHLGIFVRNRDIEPYSEHQVVELGDHGVKYKIPYLHSNETLFTSSRETHCNTYVMVKSEEHGSWVHPDRGRVTLYSINGIGEIRWDVSHFDAVGGASSDKEAVAYFNLKPFKKEE